ncbi:MAG: hypothetical protein U5K00_00035 [Melioribacteraceae bacterium]|nr:hypothetical protein [Melioribacteraceae bacterium]
MNKCFRESSLWRKDFQTGEEGLTLAAGLIFGKDVTIQNLLPAYKVEILVRKIDIDRYDDRQTFRTNLIDTYISLLKFINNYLPEKFFTEDGQRKDLRELIFREIIGNIIVHREYTSAHSSEIIIYKDSVVTVNPNRPLFHGPIDLYKFNPYPKNPNIRKFFSAFGWTDEIGSGIRNTTKYLKLYVPGAEPIFYENELFRTDIPLTSNNLTEHLDSLISWFGFPVSVKEHLSAGLSQIQLDSSFADLSWEELLLKLVPTWQQKGTNLEPLDWPENPPFIRILAKKVPTLAQKGTNLLQSKLENLSSKIEESIKEVPSWKEKSTNLLHKKADYLLRILFLTAEAIKLDNLMKMMDYKNKSTFRK